MCHSVSNLQNFQVDTRFLFLIDERRKFFQAINANFSFKARWYEFDEESPGIVFSCANLRPPVMTKESLEKLTLPELCDLLVENTILLLESMERKTDGVILRDQRKNVELLQEVIRTKRTAEANL